MKGGFFSCYLLNSLSPICKNQGIYIGFTLDPKRRIKQHNGELRRGALRTKRNRPWEMALCIYGFPTNRAALQFEWAWQYPRGSAVVFKAAEEFNSFFGIANKVKWAFTMLTLPSWQSMDLTVNFFSPKYLRHCAGCPRLPEQMNMQMCSMDELPCYTGYEQNVYQQDDLDIEKNDGFAEHKNEQYVGPVCRELKETLEYSTVPNCSSETEETTHVFSLNLGRNDLIQPRALEEYNTQPSHTNKPLEEVVSSSCVAETFQRSIFPLGKACSVELVLPAGKDLPTKTAAGKDKVLIKNPMVLSNVEVVDLSTPEPGCRTNLQTKNGRTDSLKFIDLTRSPIVV